MSKLWIVHRNPQSREALARIAGLARDEMRTGDANAADFEDAPAPAVVVLGLAGDFERELDFAHRLRGRLARSRWILLTAPEASAEAARLFDLIDAEIVGEPLPSARMLRARIAGALSRRNAESLAERRTRGRIADRFSAWLGGVEVPGLLRALDPSLANLPLLVRGVPGSGRALLARYVELFRGAGEPALRVHARDLPDPNRLASKVATLDPHPGERRPAVWIDEVDALSISTQQALAEWILYDTPPGPAGGVMPQWIATAGPAQWQDPLEPSLERAFAPLVVDVPSLADHPETLGLFAREVFEDWTRTIGGPPRRIAEDALSTLAGYPWQGDRAEVEAVLRATLAATNRDPIEAADLRFPMAPGADETRPDAGEASDAAQQAPHEERLPIVEAVPEEETESALEFDESTLLSEASFAIAGEDAAGQDAAADLDAEFARLEAQAVEPAPASPATSNTSDTLDTLDTTQTTQTTAPPESATAPAGLDAGWRRLARSLSHEIRNPLVSIRTFAELLPEHYADETFRERFTELVGRDVAHIDDVVSRLQSVAEREKADAEAIDVSAMIEGLLEERRGRIEQRRLLVLRELERDAPLAWADASSLRVALAGLLDRALDTLPERGDLFVATRLLERGSPSASRLRILLRHHNPEQTGPRAGELEELAPTANELEMVLAETVVEANGGSLTIDSTDTHETLILIDLQTPH